MTVPLRFGKSGEPLPMGVLAAAVKMGLIVAQEDKGADRLTEGEQRAVTVASKYLGTEYSRVADSNERLMRELAKKDQEIAALLEVIRELGAGQQATDGGGE
jgi:hypothetical protein